MSNIPTFSRPGSTSDLARGEQIIRAFWSFAEGLEVLKRFRIPGPKGALLTIGDDGNVLVTLTPSLGSLQFLDSLFSLLDNLDPTKVLQFQLSGITTGTTRTLTVPNASGTLALLSLAQTFTAAQTINPSSDARPLVVKAHAGGTQDFFRVENSSGSASLSVEGSGGITGESGTVILGDGAHTYPFLAYFVASAPRIWGVLYDGAGSMELQLSAAPSGSLIFPGTGGTVVTTTATQSITAKTLGSGAVAGNIWLTRSSVGLSSNRFRDFTTATKQLFIQLDGATGDNIITLSTTAARTYTFPDDSITVSGSAAALTSGRVPFATTGGILTDDADLTFATDTLSATKVAMSSLTSGRIPVASTAGLLVDDADLTFATDTLTATKIVAPTSIQVGGGAVVTKLDHGTYTPTLTNVANIDASTAYQAQWMQVGNTVTVSGKVDIDPTAAGQFQLGISLPVASTFGAEEDCAGVAYSTTISEGGGILADAANDRAAHFSVAVAITSQPRSFTFTYQVL